MSTYYIRLKALRNALTWQEKAINSFEVVGDKSMLSKLYTTAGNVANTNKDSALAITYFNKALAIAMAINNKENIGKAYKKISTFYNSRNDFEKTYTNYNAYTAYKDSATAEINVAKIEEIKSKYEAEKKDYQINKLKTNERIKQLQIEKQTALLAGNILEAKKKTDEIELLSKAQELQALKITQQDEQLENQKLIAKTNEQQLQLIAKEKQLQERKLKDETTIRNFILAGICLIAIIAYFLFNRYQLKRTINEQNAMLLVRNNIAKDLHDEIGSTLTSIKILSEASEKNVYHNQEKASGFLQKITEQSAAAQQGISDIVWSVKPENDKLENMVVRMREYVAQTLETKGINTAINIDETILNKTLNMAQRRDFLLIFREAINNISKYANASKVQIILNKINSQLQLSITDNGIGFDTQKVTSSSGLKNMKSRAIALNGTLEIQSTIGTATIITLNIPTT